MATNDKTKQDEERAKREREEREKRERSTDPQQTPEEGTENEETQETPVEETEELKAEQTITEQVPEKLSTEMTKQPWQTEPRDPVGHDLDAEGHVTRDNHTRRAGTIVPQGDSPATTAMNEELSSSAESRQKVQEARQNLSANYQPHPDPDIEAAKRS